MMKPPFPMKPSRHPAGPEYNDYQQPDAEEFYRSRSQIVTMWRKVTVLLDVASAMATQEITGDFIFCDMSSTGVLSTLEFNNQMAEEAGGFTVGPGWYHKGPFTLAKMSWAAQPGKFVKLLYATGLEAYPGTTGFTINGTTAMAEQGSYYGASFASNTALGGATNEVILAPASNLNGLIVWASCLSSAQNVATATSMIALMAKASAPASGVDGDVLLANMAYANTASGMVNGSIALPRPVRVAAGKGLYFRNSANAENSGYRSIQYTLL